MVQAHFAAVGDQQPVAVQVDGVAVRLVHGRHPPAPIGALQRVLGPLALDHGHHPGLPLPKTPQGAVHHLAIHLHVLLPREGVATGPRRADVAQEAVEDIGEEVREELPFGERRELARTRAGSPTPQRRPSRGERRQSEADHGRLDDVGAKQGLGFERHAEAPLVAGPVVAPRTNHGHCRVCASRYPKRRAPAATPSRPSTRGAREGSRRHGSGARPRRAPRELRWGTGKRRGACRPAPGRRCARGPPAAPC